MTQTIKILTEFYKDTNNSIPIIAIEGNHDLRKFIGQVRIGPTESWLHFLGKMGYVTFLDGMDEILKNDTFQEYSAESKIGGTIKIGNIRIFGIRYCGKSFPDMIPQIQQAIHYYPDSSSVFKILLMHFGIKGQMKGVPGIELEAVEPLHQCVNYLGLGHYHKQFRLKNWIFNPGSTETNALIESTFERGIFLVETEESSPQLKIIQALKLHNRKIHWVTLFLPNTLRSQTEFEHFLRTSLAQYVDPWDEDLIQTNETGPIIHLTLKGVNPPNNISVDPEEIKIKLMDFFNILDLRIAIKTEKSSFTLDQFLRSPQAYF